MRDLYSNDVETAAALARQDAAPDDRPSPSEYTDPPPDPRDVDDARCPACGEPDPEVWAELPDSDAADHWECQACSAGCCPGDCRGVAA